MTPLRPAPEDIEAIEDTEENEDAEGIENMEATLHRERAYHDTCRAALAAMVDGAAAQVVIGAVVTPTRADSEVRRT
ncbi:hypothetical protein ACFWIO_30805, partial [Streptomyces diastatochromogenes]|uniref:hypothetical protein n=1 Tax=Streptomyces diastatochromogenes TaxID=42236 RepID=UPI00364B15F0